MVAPAADPRRSPTLTATTPTTQSRTLPLVTGIPATLTASGVCLRGCDPLPVRSATKPPFRRRSAGLRSDTMEALIAKRLIYFPPCKPRGTAVLRHRGRTARRPSEAGKGRLCPKKTPLLRADLPDLRFLGWPTPCAGPPLAQGAGRPGPKPNAWPLQQLDWRHERGALVDGVELFACAGHAAVWPPKKSSISSSKAFPHPKPLSLIKSLLPQATRPGDIVLDFLLVPAPLARRCWS